MLVVYAAYKFSNISVLGTKIFNKNVGVQKKIPYIRRRTRTKNTIKRFQKYGTDIKPKHCK